MINIYNETKTSWILKPGPDKAIFSKLKSERINGVEKSLFTRLDADKSLLDNVELVEGIKEAVHMKDIARISDERVSVTFNRKDMRPKLFYAGKNVKHRRQLLLLSLFTKYDKIVSVDSKDIFVLDEMITPEVFSHIALFSHEGSSIVIKTFNEKKKSVKIHTFTYTKDGIELDTQFDKEEECEIKFKGSRKFKPNILPETLFVKEEHVEQVKELIKAKEKEPNLFKIYVLEDDTVVETVANNRVIAAAYFAPKSEQSTSEYMDSVREYKYKFRTFFVFNEDYIITKIKTS